MSTFIEIPFRTVEDYGMQHIYFDFQEEKFVQALAFFSLQGINGPDEARGRETALFR